MSWTKSIHFFFKLPLARCLIIIFFYFLIEGEINLNWSSLGKLGKFFVDDLTELYHSYFSIYLISNRATKNNSVNHWIHQMRSIRPE